MPWQAIKLPDGSGFVSYSPELRRGSRVYADRRTAARDAKRRNRTVAKREGKAARKADAAARRKQAAKSDAEAIRPAVLALRAGRFIMAGPTADHLQELSPKLGAKGIALAELINKYVGIGGILWNEIPVNWAAETQAEHVYPRIFDVCFQGLVILGDIAPDTPGIWRTSTAEKLARFHYWRDARARLRKRCRVIARKMVRERIREAARVPETVES